MKNRVCRGDTEDTADVLDSFDGGPRRCIVELLCTCLGRDLIFRPKKKKKEKCNVHHIFIKRNDSSITILQQILSGRLLLAVIVGLKK